MNNQSKRVFLDVDYYQFLGVPPWATDAEINKAYRRLQLRHHTDKNGDLTICLLLNEIKRILLDKNLRRDYDTTRDYSDIKVQFQNASSGVGLAKLPCPEKKSDKILYDISKWKDEFHAKVFNDNVQESMVKFLDEIIENHAPTENDNDDDFWCKICDKLFVSEDDHFDSVLEPYIDALIGHVDGSCEANDDPDTPIIFDYLLKKLEPYDQSDLPTIDSKHFGTIVSAADEALKMKEMNAAFHLYREAVAILSEVSDHVQSDVFEKLLSIIIKVFDNDQHSLVEACKCLLACNIDRFGATETIQDIFRRKFMSEMDLASYKMALASLHYLPIPLNSDTWDEFLSWEQALFYNGIKEAMSSDGNHDQILDILKLINSRTVTAIEMFLQQTHQLYDLTQITGDYKVAVLLIEGTTAKQNGDVTAAADIFQMAVQLAASCSSPRISKQIINMIAELCTDPVFHHSLRINVWNELIDLRSTLVDSGEITAIQRFPSFLSSIPPATPGRIKLGRLYSPGGMLRVAIKNEDAIALRFKDSYFAKALAYFDLSMGSISHFSISCHQQAICYLLKEMERLDSSGEPATMYAYSKVVEKQCMLTNQLAALYGGPYQNISVHRFIVSALVASTKAFAKCVSTAKEQIENSKPDSSYDEIVPSLFKASLRHIWTLQKVNPLITYPCSISVSDELILNDWTNAFQMAFIEAKVNALHYPKYLPDHLYHYYQFDSVWMKWSKSPNAIEFHESRLRTMISLLNAREWDIAEVEKTMGWPLIRTTDAGWMNNEECDLNFDDCPGSDVFTSCTGYTLNSTSGEFEIYFDQGLPGDLKLFSTNDVAEIFENGIDVAFFTLENPDPSLSSHPFQEFSYWPPSLKGTDYLQTLLHADLLLKEFTTGMEINTVAPFELRASKDGFLQRLPQHLQLLLIPILERHRDPINFSSNARRFWIQIESIECKREESSGKDSVKFSFGRVTAKVNTRILTRGPDGKYQDADEKQILDSAENQFARAFTKHYDEIGQYFPILLRLKELAKIAAIRRHLGGILCNSRVTIEALTDEGSDIFEDIRRWTEETITDFRDQARDPPHPIYTEQRAASDYIETLRVNNVLGKEHLIAPGEIDRVKQLIRNNLTAADSQRFRNCANELGRVFEISPDQLIPHIRGWFDRNSTDTSTLHRLCIEGSVQAKIKSLRVLVSGLEEGGIIVSAEQTNEIKLLNHGECSWVPASFCKEFGCPVEPPPLSDESDVEYVEKGDDANESNEKCESNGSTERGELRPLEKDLRLPCKIGVPAICSDETSTDGGNLESTHIVERSEVRPKQNIDDTLPKDEEIHKGSAEDDNARDVRRKKKRKIHKPRPVKPPRIYGGVSSSPTIDWVDVGLTVLGFMPLGRLVTIGGRLLRGTFQAARLAKASQIATKGIQATGKSLSGVGRYSTLTKHSTKQVHAHHSVADAYNRQFGIKKGDGISILLRRDVHTSAHREVGKVWRQKGTVTGSQQVPRFNPDNAATHPRNVLGQMTMAERQALRQKGLYGSDTRTMLQEKINQNKTSFKEMYDKHLFDPKNPPKF